MKTRIRQISIQRQKNELISGHKINEIEISNNMKNQKQRWFLKKDKQDWQNLVKPKTDTTQMSKLKAKWETLSRYAIWNLLGHNLKTYISLNWINAEITEEL